MTDDNKPKRDWLERLRKLEKLSKSDNPNEARQARKLVEKIKEEHAEDIAKGIGKEELEKFELEAGYEGFGIDKRGIDESMDLTDDEMLEQVGWTEGPGSFSGSFQGGEIDHVDQKVLENKDDFISASEADLVSEDVYVSMEDIGWSEPHDPLLPSPGQDKKMIQFKGKVKKFESSDDEDDQKES